jgi:hypothetical protein
MAEIAAAFGVPHAVKRDPGAAIAELPLTGEERDALLAGDVGA